LKRKQIELSAAQRRVGVHQRLVQRVPLRGSRRAMIVPFDRLAEVKIE
jgi:hypothetical protein